MIEALVGYAKILAILGNIVPVQVPPEESDKITSPRMAARTQRPGAYLSLTGEIQINEAYTYRT